MKCKSKTSSGQPCQAQAISGSRFCFVHDPSQGAKRAKARKKGGLNRSTPHSGDALQVAAKPRSIQDTFSILDYVLAEALAGENGTQRNRLLVSIAVSYVDALSVGELEKRLEQLEKLMK